MRVETPIHTCVSGRFETTNGILTLSLFAPFRLVNQNRRRINESRFLCEMSKDTKLTERSPLRTVAYDFRHASILIQSSYAAIPLADGRGPLEKKSSHGASTRTALAAAALMLGAGALFSAGPGTPVVPDWLESSGGDPMGPFSTEAPGVVGMPAVLRGFDTRPLDVWDAPGAAAPRSTTLLAAGSEPAFFLQGHPALDLLGPGVGGSAGSPPPQGGPRALPTNEWWENLAMGPGGDVEHGPENFALALPYHVDVADPGFRGLRVAVGTP